MCQSRLIWGTVRLRIQKKAYDTKVANNNSSINKVKEDTLSGQVVSRAADRRQRLNYNAPCAVSPSLLFTDSACAHGVQDLCVPVLTADNGLQKNGQIPVFREISQKKGGCGEGKAPSCQLRNLKQEWERRDGSVTIEFCEVPPSSSPCKAVPGDPSWYPTIFHHHLSLHQTTSPLLLYLCHYRNEI
eukprot:superscaffoldBa00000322_g3788